MFKEIKTYIEYHNNGQIAYTDTRAILDPSKAHLFENSRIHPTGYKWIRIGIHLKYYNNGQLAWILVYDEHGNVIKKHSKNFRKDGTPIF